MTLTIFRVSLQILFSAAPLHIGLPRAPIKLELPNVTTTIIVQQQSDINSVPACTIFLHQALSASTLLHIICKTLVKVIVELPDSHTVPVVKPIAKPIAVIDELELGSMGVLA